MSSRLRIVSFCFSFSRVARYAPSRKIKTYGTIAENSSQVIYRTYLKLSVWPWAQCGFRLSGACRTGMCLVLTQQLPRKEYQCKSTRIIFFVAKESGRKCHVTGKKNLLHFVLPCVFFYKIGLSAARQYEMQRANSAPGQQ